MFLTKASLRSSERGGTGALAAFLAGASASIGQGHHLVWSLFGDRGGERRFLYRMTGPTAAAPILVASAEEPRDDHNLWDLDIKPLRLLGALAAGDRVEWSIRVNATVKSRAGTGKARSSAHCIVDRARREGMEGTSAQVAAQVVPPWLEARLARAGLDATAEAMTVQAYDKRRFGHSPNGYSQPVVIATTDVVGTGTVRDPDILRAAMLDGIGGGKAYGCGLLLVRRAA
ncbi:type I-E CRISPR-associated protein Cas6/Cse3/CasE [Roseomonas sp. E05]|uniref:type I-E CRISPR-associated protein Cas6/Cse3/CasE n=1 Tax=Roseomonas sp. E05 TaxID=3046310 RepID=UPI0024B9BCF7|nr:type I-E CRISPR-associated protein Cas6/Cse3/CasE [Roseomonas sp. E05]MDJ0390907.1 type I-E CRISPR-associated protein Cas6/Cse3/CasE [Roseomonas sp. E05]